MPVYMTPSDEKRSPKPTLSDAGAIPGLLFGSKDRLDSPLQNTDRVSARPFHVDRRQRNHSILAIRSVQAAWWLAARPCSYPPAPASE
jgi:hypothetical protein